MLSHFSYHREEKEEGRRAATKAVFSGPSVSVVAGGRRRDVSLLRKIPLWDSMWL